jgi:hypothetical protein
MFGELNPMSKEDDYKLNAARTVNLANRAATLADKGHLLDPKSGSILPIAPRQCGNEASATRVRRANILCCAVGSAPTGARHNKSSSTPFSRANTQA